MSERRRASEPRRSAAGAQSAADEDDVAQDGGDADVEAVTEDFAAGLVAAPRVISVFPLQNTVLFPHAALPLHIFEERYKAMVADALDQDRALAIALTDDDEAGLGAREICAAGAITRVEHLEDGEKNIVVTGSFRCRIVELLERRPYLVARVEPIEERGGGLERAQLRRAYERLRELAIQWVFFQDTDASQELIRRMSLIAQPGHLADFVAFHLLEDPFVRQEILETRDVLARAHRVTALVRTGLERLRPEE